MDLEQHPDQYIHLLPDCKVVRGAARSALYDLTCGEFTLLPNESLSLLEQFKIYTIGQLLEQHDTEEQRDLLSEFVGFLDEQSMILPLKNPARFPDIPEVWDFAGCIQNAIIDYDGTVQDMPDVFRQLDELGCRFLQLRCFNHTLSIGLLSAWLSAISHTAIESVEVIMPLDNRLAVSSYKDLMEAQPLISLLVLHTAGEERNIPIDYEHNTGQSTGIEREIVMVTTILTSELHCGKISLKSLSTPDPVLFMENKAYNGCLNRKISLDTAGNIRNCPSMKTAYGNIREISLQEALHTKGFTDLWGIHKDLIKTCRDCEFRYACSDCRAYLEDPDDLLSKPLKCGYDPYTATWEDWSSHPLKQKAIQHYGIPDTTLT